MTFIIVGLGNPGKEYEKTRHNAGRDAITLFAKKEGLDDFIFNKTANAFVAKGAIGGENVVLILPETFVNASGKAVGVTGTPTLLMIKGKDMSFDVAYVNAQMQAGQNVIKLANGNMFIVGAQPYETFKQAIDTLLK